MDRGEREALRQVDRRDANERVDMGPRGSAAAPARFRCECGDHRCRERVRATVAEYEAVRERGCWFLATVTHENPETSFVVSTNARFSVIETIATAPRRIALRSNPRRTWPRPSRRPSPTADAV
jgi:hypothetical protein